MANTYDYINISPNGGGQKASLRFAQIPLQGTSDRLEVSGKKFLNGDLKMRDDSYDVAQICLNGHVINSSVNEYPQFNKKFCDKCGAATITNCINCNSEIQGEYCAEGFIGISHYTAPAFCPNCGKPYPWIEARTQSAHDLAQELENISDDDKEILTQSINEIVKDSPKTTLAATRFKKILSKTSKPIVDAFRDILIDIVSETAKKLLWP